MSIYVKFKKPKTIKKFIEMFFSGPAGFWGNSFAAATYHDKDCTILQCEAGRYRSPQDLWECVKTYFPSTKLETVVSVLTDPDFTIQGRYFYPDYCSTIDRPLITSSGSKYKPECRQWNDYLESNGIDPEKIGFI